MVKKFFDLAFQQQTQHFGLSLERTRQRFLVRVPVSRCCQVPQCNSDGAGTGMLVVHPAAGVSRPDRVFAWLQPGHRHTRRPRPSRVTGRFIGTPSITKVTVPVGVGRPGVSGNTTAVTTNDRSGLIRRLAAGRPALGPTGLVPPRRRSGPSCRGA